MPTYDYRCSKCSHTFETLQSIVAMKLIRCPACSQDALERQFGIGSGVTFKGAGFYATDYKRPEAK